MLQQCTVEALIQKMNEHAGDKKVDQQKIIIITVILIHEKFKTDKISSAVQNLAFIVKMLMYNIY